MNFYTQDEIQAMSRKEIEEDFQAHVNKTVDVKNMSKDDLLQQIDKAMIESEQRHHQFVETHGHTFFWLEG